MSNDNRNNTQNEYKYHTVFVLLDWFFRNTQATNWIDVTKNCLSKQICFQHFVLAEILKWKTWIHVWFGQSKQDFFPVVKSEINCPSDGLVKTTKSIFTRHLYFDSPYRLFKIGHHS